MDNKSAFFVHSEEKMPTTPVYLFTHAYIIHINIRTYTHKACNVDNILNTVEISYVLFVALFCYLVIVPKVMF